MSRWPTIVAITQLCACGRLDFDLLEDANTDAAPVQFGPWGNLRPLTEVNTGFEEIAPSLSADARELYFASNRNGNMVLFRSPRPDRDAMFGPAAEVPLGEGYVSEPGLAKSGLVMYLHTGGILIARTERATPTAAWSVMPTPVSELAAYDGADFGGDDLRVVFNDFHPTTFRCTDLYESTRPDPSSPWSPPRVIAELVTGDDYCYPSLRGDGLEIVFQNNSDGGGWLWRAERASMDAPFEPAQRIALDSSLAGKPVQDPKLSDDGTILIFNVLDGVEHNLYMVTRSQL